MNQSLWERAAEFLKVQRHTRVGKRILGSLAAVVVFVTTYMLILPAIALERPAYCGMEEHIHTQECLGAVRVHAHDESCYDDQHQLVCEFADNLERDEENWVATYHKLACGYSGNVVHTSSNWQNGNRPLHSASNWSSTSTADNTSGTGISARPGVGTASNWLAAGTADGTAGTGISTGSADRASSTSTSTGSADRASSTGTSTGSADRASSTGITGSPAVSTDSNWSSAGSADGTGTSVGPSGASILICGLEEDEDHRHTEECYQWIQPVEYEANPFFDQIIMNETDFYDDVIYDENELNGFYDGEGEEDGVEDDRPSHIHTEDCYVIYDIVLKCGLEEHTHTQECYLTPEEQEMLRHVRELIRALPAYDIIGETLEAYETAGDTDGYAAYYQTVQRQVQEAFQAYEALGELQAYIDPEEAAYLENLAGVFSAVIMEDQVTSDRLEDFLTDIKILDSNGTPVESGGELLVGSEYQMEFKFQERMYGDEKQFAHTVTYTLPSNVNCKDISPTAFNVEIKDGNGVVTDTIPATYQVSNGVLTVVFDENKETDNEIDKYRNTVLTVTLQGTIAEIQGPDKDIVDFGGNFQFDIKARKPVLHVEKHGDNHYEDGHNVLDYWVEAWVENGPVSGITLTDTITSIPSNFGLESFDINTLEVELQDKNGKVIRKLEKDGQGENGYTFQEPPVTGTGNVGQFQLKLNDEVQLEDGQKLIVRYQEKVTPPSGTGTYYDKGVKNRVDLEADKGPGDSTENKPDPVTDEQTEVITSEQYGNAAITKEVSDDQYESGNLLHYEILVDVDEALDSEGKVRPYSPFYIEDRLTTVIDGERCYIAGSETSTDDLRKNLKVSIVLENGEERTLEDVQTAQKPEGGWKSNSNMEPWCYVTAYAAKYGARLRVGTNPARTSIANMSPTSDTYWNLKENAKIRITYDLDVNKLITVYHRKDGDYRPKEGFEQTMTLRQLLEEKEVVLTNEAEVRYSAKAADTTASYSRREGLSKTGIINDDGTITYTVSLRLDEAVIDALLATKRKVTGLSDDAVDVQFQDSFDSRWRYVPNTLKAQWLRSNGTLYYPFEYDEERGDFLHVDTETTTLTVDWLYFYNTDSTIGPSSSRYRLATAAAYPNRLKDHAGQIQFIYTLEPNVDLPPDTETVTNNALIQAGEKTYSAQCELPYTPQKIYKTAVQDEKDGDIVTFTIVVNPQAEQLNNGEEMNLTDTLGENLLLQPDTIRVQRKTDSGTWEDCTGGPYATPSPDGKEFTITIPDETTFRIVYKARVTTFGQEVAISNTAALQGQGSATSWREYTVTQNSAAASSGKGTFFLYKVDENNTSRHLSGAEFSLYHVDAVGKDAQASKTSVNQIIQKIGETDYLLTPVETEEPIRTNDEGWAKVSATGLIPGEYFILKETHAPDGYYLPQSPYTLVYYRGAGEEEKEESSLKDKEGVLFLDLGEDQTIGISYSISNDSYGVKLPETGGPGTRMFTLAGLLMSAIAMLGLLHCYSLYQRQ